jgi:rod shape-determining protein MreD
MVERSPTHLWAMRGLYAGLCLLILFLHLMPLDTVPRGWAGPNLMLALTFAWAVRRPEYVPAGLVATVFLLSDMLLHRPPGLFAALAVLGCQTLRRRAPDLRDLPFAVEWLTMLSTAAVVMVGYRVILTVFLVDQAPLGLSVVEYAMTVLVYPLVVIASHLVFGVRKVAPADLDAMRPAP